MSTPTPVKKKRGRPKKTVAPNTVVAEAPKKAGRGRGRPKKNGKSLAPFDAAGAVVQVLAPFDKPMRAHILRWVGEHFDGASA